MPDESRYYPGSVDSHAHLHLFRHQDDGSFDVEDALIAARNAQTGRMAAVIEVGVIPSDFATRGAALGSLPIVELTAGLHPTAVAPDTWEAELAVLERLLGDPDAPIVAVGECGLDYYHSTENVDIQHAALVRQFDLAARHGLPVILHNRESEDDLLELLRERSPRGVMHCFSQDEAYCRLCIDAGMHISFGGNLTYRNSNDIRAAAKIVPNDLLLVETDAPYLSPQVVRGRPNHPGHLGFTIDALAEIRGASPQALAEQTGENALRLFGLLRDR